MKLIAMQEGKEREKSKRDRGGELRGGWIDAAREAFIKHCARVAVVCGLLDG